MLFDLEPMTIAHGGVLQVSDKRHRSFESRDVIPGRFYDGPVIVILGFALEFSQLFETSLSYLSGEKILNFKARGLINYKKTSLF